MKKYYDELLVNETNYGGAWESSEKPIDKSNEVSKLSKNRG